MPKRTKIVATISSLNCTPEFLGKLYEAGMDVARLNTAHMSLEEAAKTVSNIRAVSDKIAIMIDTKGPEVRTAVVEPPLELHSGDRISISGIHDSGLVKVNYDDFSDFVEPGKRILIDDGELELMVLAKQNRVLECEALNDGTLKSRKSVNVPAVALPLPSLSTRDVEFINFAVENELDFIAHSFVRSKEDVLAVRELLNSANSKIGIIAKIENRQGVENLDEIAEAADGIMVARGDLGVEIPLAEVPEIQKRMICTCRKYCKPVITATQMLQSMIEHGVKYIVFSSTAATYGEPEHVPILETDPTHPTNCYGETKLSMERMFYWASVAHGIRFVALRYFNACGAHMSGKIGEAHDPETHLIPIILQVPNGRRDHVSIYGDDYPTRDGTCVRDYIHVTDLASAHILAAEYLMNGGENNVFNLGNGVGFTVKEIIDTAEKVVGKPIKCEMAPRRAGDPAQLVASSEKAKTVLGWKPKYDDIETIIGSAWNWHKEHPHGYDD